MSVKIKDIKTKVIKEDEGYSIACSALGVYSTGKNLQDAKKTIQRYLSFICLYYKKKQQKPL